MAEIDILREMNSGFSALHKKIEAKFEEVRSAFQEHLIPCEKRFGIIEKELEIKKALNGVQKEGRDFWKYIIRGCILFITLGALVMIWKLFTGHLDIVMK